MEIEVGEYVRSNDGYIAKIIKIQKGKRECDTYYCTDKIMASGFYEHIKKHSKDIIDLIQEGDYVNGCQVMGIYVPRDTWEPIQINVDSQTIKYFIQDEIKSIITKEQIKQIEYRIKE
jgi:hypothetical protein